MPPVDVIDMFLKLPQPVSKDPAFALSIDQMSHARQALTQIKTDLQGNKDSTNGVDAFDILPVLADFYERSWDDDMRILFFQQLADISQLGSCAQGRCTRLLQLIFAGGVPPPGSPLIAQLHSP